MKKKFPLLFVFLMVVSFGFSQNSGTTKKKEHYKIINSNNEDELRYVKAMSRASLDSLRFMDERRHIPISGTTMVIELMSAQELKNDFGKPISPFTIKDAAKARKVAIQLSKFGAIEVIAL